MEEKRDCGLEDRQLDKVAHSAICERVALGQLAVESGDGAFRLALSLSAGPRSPLSPDSLGPLFLAWLCLCWPAPGIAPTQKKANWNPASFSPNSNSSLAASHHTVSRRDHIGILFVLSLLAGYECLRSRKGREVEVSAGVR